MGGFKKHNVQFFKKEARKKPFTPVLCIWNVQSRQTYWDRKQMGNNQGLRMQAKAELLIWAGVCIRDTTFLPLKKRFHIQYPDHCPLSQFLLDPSYISTYPTLSSFFLFLLKKIRQTKTEQWQNSNTLQIIMMRPVREELEGREWESIFDRNNYIHIWNS